MEEGLMAAIAEGLMLAFVEIYRKVNGKAQILAIFLLKWGKKISKK